MCKRPLSIIYNASLETEYKETFHEVCEKEVFREMCEVNAIKINTYFFS